MPPEPNNAGTPPEVEATAADWLARRDAGLDAQGTAELLRWLAADPRHAQAFHDVETTWRVFDRPRARGDSSELVRELGARRRRRRARMISVVTASATLAAVAVWMVALRPGSHRTHDFVAVGSAAAVIQRPEKRVLEDGSVVELNRGAKIEIAYSARRRDVRLLGGEALFSVAKDPARPFVVAAPYSVVRAMGTVFAVGVLPRAMDLLVTEGKVAVEASNASEPGTLATVAAGNRCTVPDSAATPADVKLVAVSAEEVERRLAWRAPRVSLSGTRLEDAAEAFNRENAIKLTVADRALADLQLTGVFRADRVEDFVRLLEAHYGVRAVRRGPAEIVLRRG